MDHTFAYETYAAERYLLGEMTPEERDAFEEHFFTCKACGDDIQTSSVFVENAKTVFRDETRKTKPSLSKFVWFKKERLTQWRQYVQIAVPAFAALVFAGMVVYRDAVTIPALKVPQSMASPVIFDGETRGPLPKIEAGQPLHFQMMLPHNPDGSRVSVDLIDSTGKIVRRGSVEAPDYDKVLDVYFPGRLIPGRYSVVARGMRGDNAADELGRNSFQIIEPLNIPVETVTPLPPRKAGSHR